MSRRSRVRSADLRRLDRTRITTEREQPPSERFGTTHVELPAVFASIHWTPEPERRLRCTSGRGELDDRCGRVALADLPWLTRLCVVTQREVVWNLVVGGLRLLRVDLNAPDATQPEVAQRITIDISARQIPV